MTVNDPGKRLTELWVFVALDDDGDEGVIAHPSPLGPLPMIAADPVRVELLRPHAAHAAAARGRPVTIRHFTVFADVEVIDPPRD